MRAKDKVLIIAFAVCAAFLFGDHLAFTVNFQPTLVSYDPEDSDVLYNVACFYSMAGQVDEALEHLERAVEAGFAFKDWIESDSDFDPVRDDPRYRRLLDRLN